MTWQHKPADHSAQQQSRLRKTHGLAKTNKAVKAVLTQSPVHKYHAHASTGQTHGTHSVIHHEKGVSGTRTHNQG
jgi:hypothetical protein